MGCAASKALMEHQQCSAAAAAPPFASDPKHQELPSCAGAATAMCVSIPPELLPGDEEYRMRSLKELGLLGKPPDARFNEIASLMRSMFGVALAAVSLVESGHITFYAKAGDAPPGCIPRVPEAFCARVIVPHVPQMLIVEDALEDARFKAATIVTGPPYIRFYCGAPLISSDSGHRYGALFLLDTKPRQFAAEQYAMLGHFAEVITREMERDKMMRWQQQALQSAAVERTALLRSVDAFSEAVMLCDTSQPNWPLLYTNKAFRDATGAAHEGSGSGTGFCSLCTFEQVMCEGLPGAAELADPRPASPGSPADAQAAAQASAAKQQVFRARVVFHAQASTQPGSQQGVPLEVVFKPASTSEQLRADQPVIGIPSYITDMESSSTASAGYYFGILQQLPAGLPSEPFTTKRLRTSGTCTPPSCQAPSTPTRSEAPVVPGFSLLRPKEMDGVTLGPLIGKGSTGRVYRGLWHSGHVAVKILDSWLAPEECDSGPEAPKAQPCSALREALFSRSLQHPHIVTTYEYAVIRELQEADEDWGEKKVHQQIWMLMSYANRGTLRDGIERGLLRLSDGSPNVPAILTTAYEIATAMRYTHARGVLHGDLTATNVLLSSSVKDNRHWIAQVADFGLSQVIDGWEASRTNSLGTVTHMPPELLLHNQVSPAMDVWGFAVLLWEMWAGKRAWAGMSAAKIANAVITGTGMLQVPQDAPDWLQDLMRRCFERDPAQRPSFDTVVELLGPQIKASRESDRVNESKTE